jgi:hypothetical protein
MIRRALTTDMDKAMLERFQEIPAWITIPWLVLTGAVMLHAAWRRLRAARERRVERMRDLRDLGYAWSWREFWFIPRQRKLPARHSRSD